LAVVCTAVAALPRFLLAPWLEGSLPFITFFPALFIASVWGGAWSGALVLVLGSLIAALFWLTPAWSLDPTPLSLTALAAFWLMGVLFILIGAVLRALVAELAEAQNRTNLLLHETKHRAGNLLGVVQAIARQTARNASSLADFQARFDERLLALARAQDFAGGNFDDAPNLETFLIAALEPFGRERFTLAGPAAALPPGLASSFALLLHELGTNAMKYGALSTAGGQVAIGWSVQNGRVNLEWRETGGPPVSIPTRTGFGSTLLKLAFPPETGQAAIVYDPTGVSCAVSFPTAR
jgi:two-component sensor histidine kinase